MMDMNTPGTNVQQRKLRKAEADMGAEEFSEKIYDENAPTPAEFDEPHTISSTGADLPDKLDHKSA